jgi:hypothetical protein
VAELPPLAEVPPVAELPPVLAVPPEPELPPVADSPPDPLPPVELAPPCPAAPPEPLGSLLDELVQPASAKHARVVIASILVLVSIICFMASTSSFDHFSLQLASE